MSGTMSMVIFIVLAAITGVAVALVLWGEHRGSTALRSIFKPLASACFIVAALQLGALQHPYGRVLLVGLVLAAIGDVLLLSAAKCLFLGGLFAFLAGHVAYAAAFLVRGVAWTWVAAALLLLAPVAAAVARWLWPHLERPMRGPVVLYVIAIVAMVALALGAQGHAAGAPWTISLGAAGFFLSDLAVARDRFVCRSLTNRLWGLPLYYAAQLALAASVA